MSRLTDFIAGQVPPIKPHPWSNTGKQYEGRQSLACNHCPMGRDNEVHTLPDNVVSLASRRRKK